MCQTITPMALMHVFGKLMGFMPCYNLAHFAAAVCLILRGNLAHFMR